MSLEICTHPHAQPFAARYGVLGIWHDHWLNYLGIDLTSITHWAAPTAVGLGF
jgi:hypothetical protein